MINVAVVFGCSCMYAERSEGAVAAVMDELKFQVCGPFAEQVFILHVCAQCLVSLYKGHWVFFFQKPVSATVVFNLSSHL